MNDKDTDANTLTEQEFLGLSVEDVARLVRAAGPKTCVFPIDGTRRWFILEHPEYAGKGLGWEYMETVWRRQADLYRLFFDHGIDTLLTPIFGLDLLERGERYVELALPGLLWCARNEELLAFYDAYDVRVRVYGDAHRVLQGTSFAPALGAYDEIAQATAAHESRRLFFGVCAHDPAETISEIGVRYYQRHGRLPNRRQIVEAYYGEYVGPADLYIGFDRPVAYDMPLLDTGNVDLYFTVSPSPYLDVRGLRTILYDHLFSRRVDESGYGDFLPEDMQGLHSFYRANRGRTLGVGTALGGVWRPVPQVESPTGQRADMEADIGL